MVFCKQREEAIGLICGKAVSQMNAVYVYLQLYRLFDNVTPIKGIDCGRLCDKACCKGDGGMYLFPQEEKVFNFLRPDWAKIENSDFKYEYDGKKKNLKICTCTGSCDRYQRPLACRIFPLTPYLDKSGELKIIVDPRAKAVCRLSMAYNVEDFDRKFVDNVRKTFVLLCKNKEIYEFMKEYSSYLETYMKFFDKI